jgi:OOP family OmpA-OmpF porin
MSKARTAAVAALCLAAILGRAAAQDARGPDLLSFAQGAVPVSVSSAPADLKVGMEHAVAAIDGDPAGYTAMLKPAAEGDVIEIVFALPAPTRFDGFFIPNVFETPSPSQTFVRTVEVAGASLSAEGPFVPLASGQLAIHETDGDVTALTLAADAPEVRWVRLRLSGGIDVQTERSFLSFSEIIGVGAQQEAPLAETFDGVFSGRGVKLELAQDGAVVSGCYDGESRLSGTVQGAVLRALGESPAGIPSQFILVAAGDGAIRGLRSTNGAPFKPYDGAASTKPATCLAPEPPKLGCGAIVHGIGFDFDSDRIRPGSQPLIGDLYAGLSAAGDVTISIIGHSSSEGAADYNRDLSLRRAQSVVAALVALGLDADRISADGLGEDAPIASNDDEAGRSLNRRVEVRCAG